MRVIAFHIDDWHAVGILISARRQCHGSSLFRAATHMGLHRPLQIAEKTTDILLFKQLPIRVERGWQVVHQIPQQPKENPELSGRLGGIGRCDRLQPVQSHGRLEYAVNIPGQSSNRIESL